MFAALHDHISCRNCREVRARPPWLRQFEATAHPALKGLLFGTVHFDTIVFGTNHPALGIHYSLEGTALRMNDILRFYVLIQKIEKSYLFCILKYLLIFSIHGSVVIHDYVSTISVRHSRKVFGCQSQSENGWLSSKIKVLLVWI